MKNRLGFTLIELLVVVLIIGILAAIALPQYQKAVEKSRVTEAVKNVQILKRNIDLFLLSNGFPATSSQRVYLEDLQNMGAGTLEGGYWPANHWGWYATDNFEYSASCYTQQCYMEITSRGKAYYTLFAYLPNSESAEWVFQCITQRTKEGREICKALERQGFNYEDVDM